MATVIQSRHRQIVSISPLGAGDLIDRAVRLYRNNFWTFVLIAAPPVVICALLSVAWTVAGREIFSPQADRYSPEALFYYIFTWLGMVAIWIVEVIATLVVMGGASRNFVRHLLFSERISFGETYRNAWGRLPGLIFASTIMTLFLAFFGGVVFYLGMLGGLVLVFVFASALSSIPLLAIVVSVFLSIAVIFSALWLFFLVASRLAYVPQIMLVEGQGVFAAIGRSAMLASGNVRRLMALFVFTIAATYAALALLYVPLAWYARYKGVEIMTFETDLVPAWYEIAYNLIWQLSLILLSPIWMVGLCLLYVDERVRHEGYDIEMMAASRLGDIPNVPHDYVNPLQPALASQAPPVNTTGITTLGLK